MDSIRLFIAQLVNIQYFQSIMWTREHSESFSVSMRAVCENSWQKPLVLPFTSEVNDFFSGKPFVESNRFGWQVNKEFRLEVPGTNWLISLSETLRFWCRCDGVKQNFANFSTLTKLIVTFGNQNDPEQSIFWKSTRTSSEHHHCSWFTIDEKLETVNSWK